jgi:hypothetical protein
MKRSRVSLTSVVPVTRKFFCPKDLIKIFLLRWNFPGDHLSLICEKPGSFEGVIKGTAAKDIIKSMNNLSQRRCFD